MKKVSRAADAAALEQIPNIGPSLADDLRRIGQSERTPLALDVARWKHETAAVESSV